MDVNVLKQLLNGVWAEEKQQCLDVISGVAFNHDYGSNVDAQREQVLKQLQLLKDNNIVMKAFPREFGGEDNYGGHVAAFEEIIIVNPSLQIKAGVQYGLFAAAIQHLGTQKHHKKFLKDVLDLKILGSYGMTESGHGSDVFNIETTATFDSQKQGFIINSPNRSSWKDYLGNAAKHASWAVIFAQLYVNNICYGVHGFMVQIRTPEGVLCDGVQVEDDGVKGGLNGVDNGRVSLNNVFTPIDNMLDRYGSVSPDGIYSSLIENPNRRFFAMLGTLVQGRVSLDGAAVAAAKFALQLAVTYAHERVQFKNSAGEESTLFSYPSHQKRLTPLIAETYAAVFAHQKLLQQFDDVFTRLAHSEGEEVGGMESLETFAAAMKQSNTWHALNVLQQTREACGGNGFLNENRIVGLKNDFDVYVTFEGDNTVLTQLVGKRAVQQRKKQLSGMSFAQKLYTIFTNNHPRMFIKPHTDSVSETLQNMVDFLATKTLLNIKKGKKLNRNMDEVLLENQNNIIVLGELYSHQMKYAAFAEAVKCLTVEPGWAQLKNLQLLYGYTVLQKMVNPTARFKLFTTKQISHINETVDSLITQVASQTKFFVDVFGYLPEIVNPPMLLDQKIFKQSQ